ncbi:MAG TPA: ABC-F family ATP-binding cassette domain-containing protein [Thermoanaerobaculia bacterium]|nr:ABC-F family ATP-binding cassette domain-containing protein [Thermoanaerobaculia bacterium]
MSDRPLLLSCEGLTRGYVARPLFSDLSFGLAEGDRVGLVGPNGSGKSTLLRILAGLEEPDLGTRSLRRGVRLGYVLQDADFSTGAEHTVEQVLLAALHGLPGEDFERAGRVAATLGRAGFADPGQAVAMLSGGWTKRLAIARELVREPDILLLDEPTNHLDLDGILWLEALLGSSSQAFLVVSHDRYFLERVANRMMEIDRRYPDGFFTAQGGYSEFLERRDEALRGQAEYQASLANRARRELEWLRRGAKARTTKAKGRIQSAGRLLDELAELRERTAGGAPAGIDFAASGRKTKKLLLARGLEKSFGERRIVDGLDLLLTPGTRLGLLGPNGSGKTTLLNLLAGRLAPDGGEIERAQQLAVVFFEQGRESLDQAMSLRRALAPEGDSVVYRGREVHVAAWAKRFLFRSEQLDTPVARLSGGERARILIARLMLRPADLLILDEPTNDLDIPTLEVLEESLLEFPGALVLVTHDRYLLDRVATVILALDGRGGAEYFADSAQWEAARQTSPTPARSEPVSRSIGRPAPKRLSYQEKKEWEGMEARILEAEDSLAAREAALADPKVGADPAALQERYQAVEGTRAQIERLYARWAELEAKQR